MKRTLVEMPKGGDPSGIPPTSEVKNRDILVTVTERECKEVKRLNAQVAELLRDLVAGRIRTITIVRMQKGDRDDL